MIRLILVGLLFAFRVCLAENFYISNAGGSVSCNGTTQSSQTPAYFNSSGNWANPKVSGKIGPGDTVWLCGTITGTVNITEFTIPTGLSGTAGNPITIKADATLDLTSPAWSMGGAIVCSNSNYITLDGGAGGKIENTANGTLLANQIPSEAIGTTGCSNLTIQNWIITNMYMRQQNNLTDFTDVDCIVGFSGSNVLVTHNTIDHCRVSISLANLTAGAETNYEVSSNTITFTAVGISIATTDAAGTIDSVLVHDNDLGGGGYLFDAGGHFHLAPIHMFTSTSGAITNTQIYNNYFHGVWTVNGYMTSLIELQNLGSNAKMFNNVVSMIGTNNQGTNGDFYCDGNGGGSNNCQFYNNTFHHADDGGAAIGVAVEISGAIGGDVRNNVFDNVRQPLYANPDSNWATSDYNVFWQNASDRYGNFNNLSQWNALGYDVHSLHTNPNLNLSTYQLGAGSSAINLGVNLTSLGIAKLDLDKSGFARPGAGVWDAGAFQVAPPAPALGMFARMKDSN